MTATRLRDASPLDRWKGVAVFFAILLVAFVIYLVVSLHGIASSTRALLTNGKTSSAVSAKKTEKLATEIKQLIENGKTTGAQNSARAASAAAAGNVILHQAETLIGSEIAGNHATGIANHAVLCSLASTLKDTAPAVTTYCKGVSP